MNSGSWSSYQSALPPEARSCGERDDDPGPVGRHDHEPPYAVAVVWYADVPCPYFGTGENAYEKAQCGRVFGAERWRWKHILAWRDAMARRFGHAEIEEWF